MHRAFPVGEGFGEAVNYTRAGIKVLRDYPSKTGARMTSHFIEKVLPYLATTSFYVGSVLSTSTQRPHVARIYPPPHLAAADRERSTTTHKASVTTDALKVSVLLAKRQ